jgi:hypothetical protein
VSRRYEESLPSKSLHNSQTQLCCDLWIGAWTAQCRVLADTKIIMSSAETRSTRRIRSEVCFWPMRASPQRNRNLLPGDHVGPAHSTACLYHKPSPRGCARAALQGRDRTRHPPPWDSPCHRSLRSEGFDNPRCSLVCSRAGLYSYANCWGFSARSRTEVKIPALSLRTRQGRGTLWFTLRTFLGIVWGRPDGLPSAFPVPRGPDSVVGANAPFPNH